MTNLITDYINNVQTKSNAAGFTPQVSNKKSELPAVKNSQTLKDEFVKEHKKNGLFERFYNFLKNKTNFGTGSKTVATAITDFENGSKTEKDVRTEILKYRESQKNGQQLFGDLFSATAAAGTYFGLTNKINKLKTLTDINGGKLPGMLGTLLKETELPIVVKIEKMLKNLSKGKVIGLGVVAAMYIGGLVKSFVLNVNRIGSKEFKYDKKNKPPKAERKAIRKAKRKEKFKNFATGALNGLFTPIIGIAGGIVGVPTFLAASFGVRYAAQNKDKKSLKDFGEKLKDNAVINTVTAGLIAVPLLKRASYAKVLNKNLEKVAAKLKGAELAPAFTNTKTAYTQLEDMLLNSENINRILKSDFDVSQQITKLTDENIFAAKFIQISNNYGTLSAALRENCPSTRTIEEAAEFISQTFGNKYKVSKQLGVGTIAETYLAKDIETGKEVCIKILKKGISAEKIDADKRKMIELIKSEFKDPKEQEYLLKNLEDLAQGIRKEVDFKNEMEAAKQLKKYTKKAKVVEPIEVRNNIYVMEKANGISLKTLQESIALEQQKKICLEYGEGDILKEKLLEIEKKLNEIRAKAPDFDLNGITNVQLKKMLNEYIFVNTEQFNAINRNGKVLHADIHPGNVFIDLDALKAGKGKVLTLIDTGNTVSLSKLQSKNALKLTQYINNGNVKDITKYILDGATLPDGMTKEAAVEIMEKELNKFFFDNETQLDLMTNNSLLELTSNIMRKYDILPSNTQLNFEKAKKSASKSFKSFVQSFFSKKYANADFGSSTFDAVKIGSKLMKDVSEMLYRYKMAEKLQDMKNLSQIGYRETFRRNPNMLKTNNEDHLVYKFKQQLENEIFDKMDID